MAKKSTVDKLLDQADQEWATRIADLAKKSGSITRADAENVATEIRTQFQTGDKKIDTVVGGFLRDSVTLLEARKFKIGGEDAHQGPSLP